VVFSKEPPVVMLAKTISDYFRLFTNKDVHWLCFFYTVSFGGSVGLAYSLFLFFRLWLR
jgi:NNP family nitrate/nitrite transporter-like MFS transporter